MLIVQIACRCQEPLNQTSIEKIAMFCQVGTDQVFGVHDVNSTYHVPMLLKDQHMVEFLKRRLHLEAIDVSDTLKTNGKLLISNWRKLLNSIDRSFETVSIALVGKYTDLQDSYISVVKSLEHAAMRCNRKLSISWVDSSHLEQQASHDQPREFHKAWHTLCSANGILIPGGFGLRGTEGMIAAAKWAREKKFPYLGICLGLQIAVIEFARNVCGIKDADSAENKPDAEEPVVIYMPEIDKSKLGGTMRLGLRETRFEADTEWSKIRKLYGGVDSVFERHRHRYEVNPDYVPQIEKMGLRFVGKDEQKMRMEIIELPDHPYYVGTQYHPEFLSRPLSPSEPFLGLIAAAAHKLDEVIQERMSSKN